MTLAYATLPRRGSLRPRPCPALKATMRTPHLTSLVAALALSVGMGTLPAAAHHVAADGIQPAGMAAPVAQDVVRRGDRQSPDGRRSHHRQDHSLRVASPRRRLDRRGDRQPRGRAGQGRARRSLGPPDRQGPRGAKRRPRDARKDLRAGRDRAAGAGNAHARAFGPLRKRARRVQLRRPPVRRRTRRSARARRHAGHAQERHAGIRDGKPRRRRRIP